jgi:ATP-dependent protease ClpP protease subunit|tara:strand:+ start:1179 stop:1835 length:657 start_codon:yes stop_codon:yes gene_type:complete
MFKFIPRNATTRAQSKNANLIIKNDDCDEDDEEGTDTLRKITRENNHIYYHAEVDRGSIFEMIELLRKCELDNIINAHKMCIDDIPIYLHINSFGGSIFDALTGIDAIQSCKVPVYTIIEGSTASAGTLLSVVGAKRFMRPNAYMLIHQLSAGAWGKMVELEDDFENNKILMEKIKNIYINNANIPKKQLNEVLKHDLWWDFEKCKKFGLIDEEWNRS